MDQRQSFPRPKDEGEVNRIVEGDTQSLTGQRPCMLRLFRDFFEFYWIIPAESPVNLRH